MTVLVARTALNKARYFLAQAVQVQNSKTVLKDQLPFAANLEAAIIYARSSIDHLQSELKPHNKDSGYKRWHETKLSSLTNTSPVFACFIAQRNIIIHEGPVKTRANISLQSEISLSITASVAIKITRADGTVEHRRSDSPPKSSIDNSPTLENEPASITSTTFYIAGSSRLTEPAIIHVEEFIDICEAFICSAETQFP